MTAQLPNHWHRPATKLSPVRNNQPAARNRPPREIYCCFDANEEPETASDFFLRAESLFNVASEIEHLDNEPSFGTNSPPIISYYGTARFTSNRTANHSSPS